MEIVNLQREFKIGDRVLPDPDPKKSPEDVAQFYAPQYPELTNVSVNGPKIEDDKQIFTFNTSIGKKG